MPNSKLRPIVKIIIFFGLFFLCLYLGRLFHLDVDQVRQKLSLYPLSLSGFIFIILYVGLTSLIWLGPHDILRVAAAILFGANISTLFIWIGEIINSFVMFHLSRFFGREFVEQRMKVKGRDLDRVADDYSPWGVIAWKINPFIPGRFTDLGYGLTGISFRRYVVPASIVNLPRIFWQQYILADLGLKFFKDFNATISYVQNNSFFTRYTFVYLSAVVISIIIASRKKIKQRKREIQNG